MGYSEGLVTGLIAGVAFGVGIAYFIGYLRYRQWRKGKYNPWK